MTEMQYFVQGAKKLSRLSDFFSLNTLLAGDNAYCSVPNTIVTSFTLFLLRSLNVRCCEYALLILEQWPDAPEIQRSADLFEDLIRCCVADAMSEVKLFEYVNTFELFPFQLKC